MNNSSSVKYRKTCRGCGASDLFCFLDLGPQPLAGSFIRKNQINQEKKYPLKLYYCSHCKLVQVTCVINPQILFEKYNYASSNIQALSNHFKDYAAYLKTSYLKAPGSSLLEFGSNDGILLQHLSPDKKIKVYGIDPSRNVTQLAKKRGFNVRCDYFNQKSARSLLKTIGPVDVVTGSNVFAHTDNISEIVKAAKVVLKPTGVFIVEVHYLRSLIKDRQYDTFYHEHLSYYSVTALKNIFKLNGLKVIDVQALPQVHGGSIRVITAFQKSKLKIKASVQKYIKSESKLKITALKKFASEVELHKMKLKRLLDRLRNQGKSLAAYGASGRATILLNYCGLDSKYLDYVVDISPLRAGKLMPGVHVPIIYPADARKNPPAYFLVTAWNYYQSILSQESGLIKKGVKFIIPLPRISIK